MKETPPVNRKSDSEKASGRSEDAKASGRKRTYARPVLTDYGPIGKLTQTGSWVGTDSMAMMMSVCL